MIGEKVMKAGDKVFTPRFCTVTIEEVFVNKEEAYLAGYTEPTHYEDAQYDILGKGIDMYRMRFAGYIR